MLDENSRVLAFTITGKNWRLDRGSWNSESTPTVGLEILGQTNAKINSTQSSLSDIVKQDWVPKCSYISLGLPQPQAPATDVKVQFKANCTINNLVNKCDDQDWTFEVALPWELLGTTVGKKIVGINCLTGSGIMPSKLTPTDGMSLRMNFFRVNDDKGGNVNTQPGKATTDLSGNPAPSGTLTDEWFVYQGDRYHPKEWANFVLSKEENTTPDFQNFDLHNVWVMDGRRVRLSLTAPKVSVKDPKVSGKAASRYEIRTKKLEGTTTLKQGEFTEATVDEGTWASMQTFENAYQPAQPGTPQSLDVIGLQPGRLIPLRYVLLMNLNDLLKF